MCREGGLRQKEREGRNPLDVIRSIEHEVKRQRVAAARAGVGSLTEVRLQFDC